MEIVAGVFCLGRVFLVKGFGMSVVEQIRDRRVAKERTNWAAYSDLLRSIASGEAVDDVETDICLSMVGRSLDDLERDVELMRRRLEWSRLIDEEPERLSLERQRERELQAAVDELRETTARLSAIVEQKRQSYRSVADRAGLAQEAQTGLLRTCMDAGLLERERRLTALVKELIPKIQEAEYELAKRKSELVSLGQTRVAMEKHAYQRTTMVSLSHPPIVDHSPERERWLRSEVEAHEEHVQQLRARMRTLQSEQAEISAAKLLP